MLQERALKNLKAKQLPLIEAVAKVLTDRRIAFRDATGVQVWAGTQTGSYKMTLMALGVPEAVIRANSDGAEVLVDLEKQQYAIKSSSQIRLDCYGNVVPDERAENSEDDQAGAVPEFFRFAAKKLGYPEVPIMYNLGTGGLGYDWGGQLFVIYHGWNFTMWHQKTPFSVSSKAEERRDYCDG